jgi:hypothetical protein
MNRVKWKIYETNLCLMLAPSVEYNSPQDLNLIAAHEESRHIKLIFLSW